MRPSRGGARWLSLCALLACAACGSESSTNGDPAPTGPYEAPTVIASGLPTPTELAHDSGKIYFLTGNGDRALRVVADQGGAVQTPALHAGAFALHEQVLYFYDGTNAIMKLAAAGGTAEAVVSGIDIVTSITVDATGVYFASHDSEGYGRISLLPSGSSTPVPVSSVHSAPEALVLDAEFVYFHTAGLIMRAEKKPNGAEQELAQSTAEALAVDQDNVYWVTIHPSSLRSVPKGGGEVTILRASLDHPRDVAVDPTHVYFTSSGMGRVGRVLKDGKKPEWLATEQATPYDLALGGGRVFWGNLDDGGTIASVHAGGS